MRQRETLLLCATLFVALSCGRGHEGEDHGFHGLSPITWKGSYIEFGSDVDAEVCPATLPSENEYMEGVDEYVRSNTIYPIRYYHLGQELDQYGFSCAGLDGCIRFQDGVMFAFSKLLTHRHELIHASSIGGEHRLLEEGLATFLGTDLKWYGIADPLDIRAADGASGVQDGTIWRDILIDAPARVPAVIYLREGHPVDFIVRACGQGCSTPFTHVHSRTTEEAVLWEGFELREGLNLIRIIKPADAEGRVRFSMNLSCP